VKIRRLNETDLARNAVAEWDDKVLRLDRVANGYAPHSLEPTRKNFYDILNVHLPGLPAPEPTPWHIVANNIRKLCKKGTNGQEEYQANIEVAAALRHFQEENNARVFQHKMNPMPIGFQAVSFWHDIVFVIEDRVFIPFLDLRLSAGLQKSTGVKIAQSLQHQHLLLRDPELLDANVCVLKFPRSDSGQRYVTIHEASPSNLYSWTELERMLSETLEAWKFVLAGMPPKRLERWPVKALYSRFWDYSHARRTRSTGWRTPSRRSPGRSRIGSAGR
jgi:hypothetical protein